MFISHTRTGDFNCCHRRCRPLLHCSS